jgi:OPA family glycerol-3-phosphate transporter-like MFS transporter
MKRFGTKTRNACAIGASCFLAYAACYLGRNVLSSTLPQVLAAGVFSRRELADMGSAFFIAYGCGQLINGIAGNRVNPKIMVSTGLTVSGLCCAAFPMLTSAAGGCVLWGVCGFLCSMLWGPISKLVAENTSKQTGTVLLTLLTVASIAGNAAAYFLAVLGGLRGDWRFGFRAAGAVLAAFGAEWFFADSAMMRHGIVHSPQSAGPEKKGAVASELFASGVVPMTVAAMLNGIVRNAVTFWIPTYLSERFSISAAEAAGITSVQPFICFGGALLSMPLVKKAGGNEKKALTVFFAFTALMFGAMQLLGGRSMALSAAALFCAGAAMTGGCNLIFTYYVIRFSGTGKISGITGFLDFVSYLAASAANSLFSSLLPEKGWDFIVGIWTVVALAGTGVSWFAAKKYAADCAGTPPDACRVREKEKTAEGR